MKILVIGGGFVATSLVERLEIEGHEVIVYSRNFNSEIRCRQILGDIFNFDEFKRVFIHKPQVVIHTAWITTPGIYKDDDSNFKYAEFTKRLGQFILFSDVEHLLILGTCAEYGRQSLPSLAGVTLPAPLTLYAKQKNVALESVKSLLLESSVRFSWARVFYPYGQFQDPKRLIPKLIYSIRAREPISLADTTSVYDWVTTRDVSSAVSWIIANELPTELDIGTSFGYTNLQVLQTLERLLDASDRSTILDNHALGVGEVYVVNKNSPLLSAGWISQDTLNSGLEWVLTS
jgi:nucleoside-diphosphate-sugar epimerase